MAWDRARLLFRSTLVTAVALALAAATLGACDDQDEDEGRLADGGQAVLTEPQIVGVTATANQGEIDMAAAYLPRGQNAQARAFAQQMITEHQAALNSDTALARSLGITPAPSIAQQQLLTLTDQTIVQLQATQPPQLDLGYMQSQVVAHQQVLLTIDQQLLPSATTPALRDQLVRMRATVAGHLDEAQAIVQNLMAVAR
jgi:putative membrane protein